MSNKMSQKEAVFSAVTNVCGTHDGAYEPSKDERASVNQILNEANRILSFKAELEAEVAEIQATIEKLNGIKFALSECS